MHNRRARSVSKFGLHALFCWGFACAEGFSVCGTGRTASLRRRRRRAPEASRQRATCREVADAYSVPPWRRQAPRVFLVSSKPVV